MEVGHFGSKNDRSLNSSFCLADSANPLQPAAAPVSAHAKPDAAEEKKHKKKHKKRSSKHSHGDGSKNSDGEKAADDRYDLSSSIALDPTLDSLAEARARQQITLTIHRHLQRQQ